MAVSKDRVRSQAIKVGSREAVVQVALLRRGEDSTPQTHDFDEVVIILEGRAVITQGARDNVYEAPWATVVEAGELHEVVPVSNEALVVIVRQVP